MKNVYIIYHWTWKLKDIFNYLFLLNLVKLWSIAAEEQINFSCHVGLGSDPCLTDKRIRTDRIRPFWPDSAKLARRNPSTTTRRCRILVAFARLRFSSFVTFSCDSNGEKYFQKNYFF